MNHGFHVFFNVYVWGKRFYYLYIWIKLKFIIMETTLSNLVDPSFEHVLHSYGLCLVSTYKYEISNYLFYFIYYLLDNHLSYLQLRQNSMAHLNESLLLIFRKSPTIFYFKIISKFFVWFTSKYGDKWTSVCDQNEIIITMEGLWGDFTTIFWIIKYLQRPIYIWNKISKLIMYSFGINFQSIPLHITSNSQHFEPIS
jgi:hypothetical protein